MPRKPQLIRILIDAAVIIYLLLMVFALFNYNPRCRETMPEIYLNPSLNDGRGGKCKINFKELVLFPVDMYEHPVVSIIEKENAVLKDGGKWSPSDCRAHQKTAVIIPYRQRYDHLMLLLKRLHPMLRRQMLDYQIFIVEQFGNEQFNRGRLMNIGVKEALKIGQFDCFVFHDVDLIPEHDLNLYYCDDHAHHISSAINEQRYHVLYYNYAGGVIALSRDNIHKVNGYSNDYWGWGSEDDDFCARTMAAGLLLTRPPRYIGRFKMVRHPKSWGGANRNDLFLSWRSRWKTDGLSNLDGSKYKVVSIEKPKLYTLLKVDVGSPPKAPPVDKNTPKESLSWFLWFFFP